MARNETAQERRERFIQETTLGINEAILRGVDPEKEIQSLLDEFSC